jgi:hypothetical protein
MCVKSHPPVEASANNLFQLSGQAGAAGTGLYMYQKKQRLKPLFFYLLWRYLNQARRRATATRPIKPEPSNHTAAGTGTAVTFETKYALEGKNSTTPKFV